MSIFSYNSFTVPAWRHLEPVTIFSTNLIEKVCVSTNKETWNKIIKINFHN